VSARAPTATGYVGLVTRAVALLIDAVAIDVIALLVGGAVNLILSMFGVSGSVNLVAAVAGGLAWLVWSGAYFVTFWTVTGQTPGARLMGIRVVRPDGRIGFVCAVSRFGGLVLSMLPLGAGFIPVLFDDRRRGLHDRIAGTVVRWDDHDGDVVTPPSALTQPAASRSS
jgi:uncharacterized RDD family membrane protein YckC